MSGQNLCSITWFCAPFQSSCITSEKKQKFFLQGQRLETGFGLFVFCCRSKKASSLCIYKYKAMLTQWLRGHHVLHMRRQNVVKCSLWLSRNVGVIPGSIFFFLRSPIVSYSLRTVFTGLHATHVFDMWWLCMGGVTVNHTCAESLTSHGS